MRVRHWLYAIPLRFRSLFLRQRVERELDEEFQFHFDQQVEASLAQGMTLADAHAAASKALAHIQRRKEECRDMRGVNVIDDLAQDLRYAVRMLRKSPLFTGAAILALALGIGVNTAVFTAYQAMVARPLDARDPGRMVNLALVRDSGGADFTFSYPDYEAYRDSAHSFHGLIATELERMRLSASGGLASQHFPTESGTPGASNAEFASVLVVSENYFQVLGVAALRGRTFDSIGIAELAASPSILISENYWQNRFAADPAILGKTIHLNGVAFTVSGITPRDFVGTHMAVPAFWMPLSLQPLVHADQSGLRNRENQICRLFGRLAPGVSVAQAQAEMTLLTDRVRTLHDPNSEAAKPAMALVWPGSPFPFPVTAYPFLTFGVLFIMAAAGMVLVVACADVGSLQLARARSRQSELQARLSLGASRPRLIRQLLTESALLALLAGGLALLFTWALLKFGVARAGDAFPAQFGTLIFDVTPNLEIFAFVFAISVFAGLLFGLAPAMESSRSALSSTIRGQTASVRSRRIQDFLVAAQVALSLVLMIAGSMFIRSSINLLKLEPGYDANHVFNLDLQFPESPKYTAARKLALVRELRMALAALPGTVEITTARPPGDNGVPIAAVPLDGETSARSVPPISYTYVEPNYFRTVGIPMFLGRVFPVQAGQVEHSIILSLAAAEQLWPGRNPIGRVVRLGSTDEHQRKGNTSAIFHDRSELIADGPAYQVVGVVRDIRGVDINGGDSRRLYLPLAEERLPNYPILIRTQSDPIPVMRAVDSVVQSIDPDLVATSSTLNEILHRSPSFLVSSLAAAIASTVGLFGLLLALMGIYGTVSYIVVLRTREIGVRMAVGAQKHNILGLILRESTRSVLAGLIAGMFLAAGASYLLRGLFFALNTVDGISFLGVSLLFLVIALLAAYPPSRRAMRVDPMVALRYE